MSKGVAASLVFAVFFAFSVVPTFAQGRSVTRIEQGDPSITYSGNWYANESPVHSGGTATLTNGKGATAAVSFTGTGISWIGVADGWAGLATVYVDGAMTIVNSYSAEARYQDTRYAIRGLPSGVHTLTIEVTHERAEGTEGSWVWIDAFDIEGGSPVKGGITAESGHVEENHPALVFTGRWYTKESPLLSAGRAVMAMDAGARVNIGFNGSGISWISYRDEWSGVARVFVDGELKATPDNYLTPSKPGVVSYAIASLPPGPHVLTIEATGTYNQSSKGAWIWVDGFEIVEAR